MQRHDLLHELHIPHQPDYIVCEKLDGGYSPHASRIESRWVNVAALHQAEHLTRVAADLQGFTIELTAKGIKRGHDVANHAIAVIGCMRSLGPCCFLPDAGVGLSDHL